MRRYLGEADGVPAFLRKSSVGGLTRWTRPYVRPPRALCREIGMVFQRFNLFRT